MKFKDFITNESNINNSPINSEFYSGFNFKSTPYPLDYVLNSFYSVPIKELDYKLLTSELDNIFNIPNFYYTDFLKFISSFSDNLKFGYKPNFKNIESQDKNSNIDMSSISNILANITNNKQKNPNNYTNIYIDTLYFICLIYATWMPFNIKEISNYTYSILKTDIEELKKEYNTLDENEKNNYKKSIVDFIKLFTKDLKILNKNAKNAKDVFMQYTYLEQDIIKNKPFSAWYRNEEDNKPFINNETQLKSSLFNIINSYIYLLSSSDNIGNAKLSKIISLLSGENRIIFNNNSSSVISKGDEKFIDFNIENIYNIFGNNSNSINSILKSHIIKLTKINPFEGNLSKYYSWASFGDGSWIDVIKFFLACSILPSIISDNGNIMASLSIEQEYDIYKVFFNNQNIIKDNNESMDLIDTSMPDGGYNKTASDIFNIVIKKDSKQETFNSILNLMQESSIRFSKLKQTKYESNILVNNNQNVEFLEAFKKIAILTCIAPKEIIESNPIEVIKNINLLIFPERKYQYDNMNYEFNNEPIEYLSNKPNFYKIKQYAIDDIRLAEFQPNVFLFIKQAYNAVKTLFTNPKEFLSDLGNMFYNFGQTIIQNSITIINNFKNENKQLTLKEQKELLLSSINHIGSTFIYLQNEDNSSTYNIIKDIKSKIDKSGGTVENSVIFKSYLESITPFTIMFLKYSYRAYLNNINLNINPETYSKYISNLDSNTNSSLNIDSISGKKELINNIVSLISNSNHIKILNK